MSETTRILIVEDLPTDAELSERQVREVLPRSEFLRVDTREDYLAALESFRPDVILSDFMLPRFDGLTALKLARVSAPETPFLILTGSMNEDTAVECMKAGAWNYVIKEHIKRLGPAVLSALEEQRLRTERRMAEEALRASEIRYRRLFESAREGILLLDAETGMVIDVNPFLIKLLGFSQETLLRKKAWELGFFEDIAANQAKFVELQQKEYDRYEDLTLETADGRRLDVEVVNNVYWVNDRQLIQCNIRDITEQKQIEEQLRQSQKMDAIGRLAGGVAHDFNNMLAVISAYSQLLLARSDLDETMRRRLTEIQKAADRATALTSQLLAFSRRQVLQPKVLDFNATVADMDKMLRRLISEDIDLRTVLQPDLGRVRIDPSQIEQVILNLAVNARDAMPQGGRLTIETQNAELSEEYAGRHIGVQPGPYVMLAVSDTGIGMDTETRSRIFEPFFTTKEKGRGTGLGLATVYGIVKQSGGDIWIYSEVGKGTTFKIYFPRVAEQAEAPRPTVSAGPPRGAETVLLVEDEEMVRKMAREVLEMHGYKVLEAASPDEAITLCREHPGPIHLLLTDVVMPQMSGRMLAESLAALRPDLNVLYMSGYSDNAIVHHGVLDTEAAFIPKPFSPDALGRKVREVLDAPREG